MFSRAKVWLETKEKNRELLPLMEDIERLCLTLSERWPPRDNGPNRSKKISELMNSEEVIFLADMVRNLPPNLRPHRPSSRLSVLTWAHLLASDLKEHKSKK